MVPCKSNAAAAPGVCCGRCGNCFFDDVDLVNGFIVYTVLPAALAGIGLLLQ